MKTYLSVPAILGLVVAGANACAPRTNADLAPPEDTERASPVDGGSSDASETPVFEDASTDAAQPYASDPANCGAKGHTCLGATCNAGVCTPTIVRSNQVDWFDIDANGALLTAVPAVNAAPQELRRGPSAPAAADEVLFSGYFHSIFEKGIYASYRYKSGALFLIDTIENDRYVVGWTGSGGQPANKTVIEELVYAGSYTVDETHLFIKDGGHLYRLDRFGGAKVQPAGALVAASNVVIDDTDAYVLTPDSSPGAALIARVPKDGGATLKSPLTGIDLQGAPSLEDLTSTHLVGSTGAKGMWILWSAPKGGGAATILFTDAQQLSNFAAAKTAGDYVYWIRNGVKGTAERSRILRGRVDGGDAPIVIAERTAPFKPLLAVDDAYVYWSGDSEGDVRRSPK